MRVFRTIRVDSRPRWWVGALVILAVLLIGVVSHMRTATSAAAAFSSAVAADPANANRLKGVHSITQSKCKNVSDPLNPYNTFNIDQCTWYVWERRHDIEQDLPSVSWGNAKFWANQAILAGYPTGDIPKVGAVVVCQPQACGGAFATGHVAFVDLVYSPTKYHVMEQNWLFGPCTIDDRDVDMDPGTSFIYAQDDESNPTNTRTVTPTVTPTPLPPCPTFAALPATAPFPTEVKHEIFLPGVEVGGQTKCGIATATKTPTPHSSPTALPTISLTDVPTLLPTVSPLASPTESGDGVAN